MTEYPASPGNPVVIVDAVRTPIGRRNGGLSGCHSVDVLGTAQKALFDRTGVDPLEVGQVVGGCVGQVGMQSMNVTRTAWLTAGLPIDVPATTVDAQCGSSQQATNLAYALVASGTVDAAVGCGVELMSNVKFGATTPKDPDSGRPINRNYFEHFEFTTQFEGSERMADHWGLTREDCDAFGKRSQDLAARAWEEDRFGTQLVGVEAPVLDDEGTPTGETRTIARDEGLRETTLEGLAQLKPSGRPDGVHTAASSSQISDGAAAVVVMSKTKAEELGLTWIAEIGAHGVVAGPDSTLQSQPARAIAKACAKEGIDPTDLDLVEINEAFAAVGIASTRELGLDPAKVNVNGGAIAVGHPLGMSGARIALHLALELQRRGGGIGAAALCGGGGQGDALIVRVPKA